jgi:hypothetical protein
MWISISRTSFTPGSDCLQSVSPSGKKSLTHTNPYWDGRVCARLAGWPWRLPARAPTDPDVRALTHPVLQPTAWPSRKGSRGYPSAFRGQAAGPRCAPPVARARVCRPALRFPPRGPPGRVPLLRRYYQRATTPCRPSCRASLPALGGTSASTRSVRSPADECAAGAWSW